MSAALHDLAAAYLLAKTANQEALAAADQAKLELTRSEDALIDAMLCEPGEDHEDGATAFVYDGKVLMLTEEYWQGVAGSKVAVHRLMGGAS